MRNFFRSIVFVAAAGLLAYWPAAQATGFYSGSPYSQPAPRAPGFNYNGYFRSGNHQRGYGFNNRGQGFYGRNGHQNSFGPNNTRRQGFYNRGHRRGFRQPRFNGYSQFNAPGYHQRRYKNFQQRNYNRLRNHNYGNRR